MNFLNKPLAAISLAALLGGLAPEASAVDRRVPKDFPTITEAIAAAQTGDRVVVSKRKEGPYEEHVLVDKNGIEILGKNAEMNGGTDGTSFTVMADDVSISGFTIRNASGPAIAASGNNIAISKCKISGCSSQGIHAQGTNILIERNTIEYVGGNGIEYAQTDDTGSTVIERNTVRHCADSGIVSSGGDVQIVRNTIEYNQNDGIQQDNGGYSDKGLIDTNKVRCNGDQGVCVFDLADGGLDINGNTIEQNGGSGTVIESGAGAKLDKNKYKRNAGDGICMLGTSSTMTNNKVETSALNGIKISNIGNGSHIVQKNTSRSNGRDGIWVSGGANNILENTTDKNLGDGINIVGQIPGDSKDNSVISNKCNRNQHEGIDNSGTNTLIASNKLSKNGPGGNGPDIAGSGVRENPEDAIGIGTVNPSSDNNKTSDDTDEDLTVPQELDF